jgi:hypothetical protein
VAALAVVIAGITVLLEVEALLTLGYWGYRTGEGQVLQFGLALGIPLGVTTVWDWSVLRLPHIGWTSHGVEYWRSAF